jgi:hypothetical protein
LVWFLSVSLGLSIFVLGEEDGQDNVSPALQERRLARIIVLFSLMQRKMARIMLVQSQERRMARIIV